MFTIRLLVPLTLRNSGSKALFELHTICKQRLSNLCFALDGRSKLNLIITMRRIRHSRTTRNNSAAAAGIPFLVFLISMLSIFSVVTERGNFASLSYSTYVLASLLLFCVLVDVYVVLSNRFAISDVLVLYFLTISAAFSGLYEVATNIFPWPRVHSEEDMNQASLLFFLFLSFFLVGNLIADRKKARPGVPVADTGRLYFAVLAIFFMSLICMSVAGGAVFAARAGERISEDVSSFSAQIISIGKGFCLTAFLFALAMWRNTRRHGFLLLVVGLCTAVWFNPISNPRFQFIGAIISTLAMLPMFVRPTALVKAGTFSGIILLNYFVFGPLKNLNRGNNSLEEVFKSFFQGISDYAFRVDFDVMQVSANTIKYVESQGVDFGYNLLGAFLFFVPRFMWTTKPYPSSIYIADHLAYDYLNISSPLPVEFYFAGGAFGVMVLAAGFGYMLRRISKRVDDSPIRFGHVYTGVLLAIVTGYMPIVMRGSLNSVAPQFGFALVAYFAINFIASRRLRRPQREVVRGRVISEQLG